jgi:hypothetical protein
VVSFPQISPPKTCIHFSSPHTRDMPRPSHSSQCYHPNNIWYCVQIMKLLIVQFQPYDLGDSHNNNQTVTAVNAF